MRVKTGNVGLTGTKSGSRGCSEGHDRAKRLCVWTAAAMIACTALVAQEPPRVKAAREFLARRGWTAERGISARSTALRGRVRALGRVAPEGGSSAATWTPLGPTAVASANFGLVTGRVTALALDPSDSTGNKLYVGTTGGGVWAASNAATSNVANVAFTALTDQLAALSGASDSSISVGALTVQPGGTGVILAGTGDPNDMMDSYYGAGILRSADGGNTWTLITAANDVASGLGIQDYSFVGEGFAGFAWSTTNSQLVVAAVSQAYGGTAVNAVRAGNSYQGLYYSSDAGATWHLAAIKDAGGTVQGPTASFASPDGNAVTSVVWNPVRGVFIAAVRYHGYYQSSDGKTWTRLTAQPGTNLTTTLCPANTGGTGSTGCPIYRGALAVNASTGDTFAWSVDATNLDQGLWQDACAISGGACTNQTIQFGKQWPTTLLETAVAGGSAGIADGSYTLALAAVPQQQDTILLAGADDLWRCSLAAGCVWRNTTNTSTCMTAAVAPYQHAIAYSTANPLEIFVGNDSGLWRSMDAVGETGQACSSTDASHFQNMNGGLGSLADVESVSPVLTSPYTMLAGLGVNGAAGVKATSATANWPQVLGGYGGPVAIDATNPSNWYVNDQTGVAIYACTQSAACTPADFGTSPAVTSANVGGDGAAMETPAPFLIDPLDASQLLIGTCRVWRGSASGAGWTSTNALSAVLDGGSPTAKCQGDGTIRTMAAAQTSSTSEVVYVGMRGSSEGGGILAGHVLKATVTLPVSGTVSWTDVTGSVTNDSRTLNAFNYGISSIYIDPHDASGKTVYVTVAGIQTTSEPVETVYRTTNGGASWTNLTANLPPSPANSVLVDPQDVGTVYVATDVGVYIATDLSSCAQSPYVCWTLYGSGLPEAPAMALTSTQAGVAKGTLVAATYGRGIWMTSLWSVASSLSSATATPSSLDFGSQTVGTTSAAKTVTLTNTGTQTLSPTSITVPGSYVETDGCVGQAIAAGAACAIQVSFQPAATGTISGEMTIKANVNGGSLTVSLTGTGAAAASVSTTPASLDFGTVAVGSTSAAQSAMLTNTSSAGVVVTSAVASAPFTVTSDLCSGTTLAASSACQIKVVYSPTAAGAATGTLTLTDAAGTQTVSLMGTGAAVATDTLSATSLSFPATATGELSAAQTVTLTNSGGIPLKSIAISVSGQFQQSNTCGGQLAAQSSCTISVVFAPTQIANLTGAVTVSDASQTQTVALNGQGVAAPALGVSPTSLTFTNQTAGVASAAQTVTVTNTGALPLANVGFQITGAAASSYSLTANSCGATLAAGASCSVGVVFTPTGTGSIAATLSVSSSTVNVAAVAVALNGSSVVTSGITASVTQIGFGAIGLGATATQTVTMTNASSYSIAAPALAVSAPFTLTQNTCSGTMAAGGTCAATVNFTPTVAGTYSGTLTASSTTVTGTLNIPVSGVGFDFTTAVSGQSSVTVTAGSSASYAMTINAVTGVTGSYTYSYACGTLPSYALCTFSPTSTTATAGVGGYVSISISTGKAKAALEGGPAKWRMLPMLCGLVLLPFALRRRKLLAMLVLLVVTLVVSSCASAGVNSSGGSGGSGSSTTTPAGTYTIPVTVTSNGVSHAVTLTLTVD
ncbi:MAG: choice-of-anchor D domain-containing protein [Terracidiphilus sp.]|nr:choice-of-anchor D domain-containing protein [Terracidiphilus sp.]